MLMLGAPEGAYANAALFVALARKLIDKEVISKEEMSEIVDEAQALLSQGNAAAMRQALQLLPWLRKEHWDLRGGKGQGRLSVCGW